MRIAILGDINSSHTIKWVNGLMKIGHDVHLITLNPPQTPLSNIEFTSLNIAANVSKSKKGISKLRYFFVVRKLKATLKKIHPEIVHAHFASSYGTLALLSGHRPYFVSLWGSDIMEFPLRSPFHSFLLKRVLKNARQVFSTSKIMTNLCRKKYGIESITIPFGIELENFSVKIWNNETDQIVIGTVKRLEEIYGIDILIRALAIAKSKTNKKIQLVIAGDGSCRSDYELLSQKLKIQDSVEFLGQIPFNQVPQILRTFDIFANLSRRESFGVSVLEASACGIPTLVSDIEGLSEVCKNDVTGRIVELNNVTQTAEVLLELIDNADLRQRLGDNGVAFVRSNFDWTKNVNEMDRFYMDLKG